MKWINITDITKELGYKGKTRVFGISTNDGRQIKIGVIKWHTGWRKYTFFPLADTLWEEDCLRDIASFIEQKTQEQKQGVRG